MSYFFDWGGMKLNEQETQNDNGSLFAGIYYYLANQIAQEPEDKENWLRMIENIRVREGIFTRYPGSKLLEQHDNYLGIILGALTFNKPEIIHEINEVPLYNYNDQGTEFNLQAQRQGGEIALYRLCDNRMTPYPLTVWLSVGLGLGGVLNLCWVRCEILRLIWKDIPWLHKMILRPGISSWMKKMGQAYKDKSIVTHYFQDKNHPIIKAAQLVNLDHGEWWRA